MLLTLRLADGVALNVGDGHLGSERCSSPRAMAIMTMLEGRHIGDGHASVTRNRRNGSSPTWMAGRAADAH
jgi:hypothetical protein